MRLSLISMRNIRVAPTLFLLLAMCVLLRVSFAHTPQDGIDSLAVSPDYQNDHTLAVIVQNSLLLSRDRGSSWKQLIAGLDNRYVFSDVEFSAGFAADGTMYAASDGDGIFRSVDRGKSWQRFNAGVGHANIGLLATLSSAKHAQITLAAGSEYGMHVRMDNDDRWQRVVSDDLQITAVAGLEVAGSMLILAGAADGTLLLSRDDPSQWERIATMSDDGGISSVAVALDDEQTPILLVGTVSGGLFRSDDLGMSFTRPISTWPARTEDCRGKPLAESNDDLNIRSIRVDYSQPDGPTIFINTWFKAVLVSADGGSSWNWRGKDLICDEQADKPPYRVPHYRNMEMTRSAENDWFLAAFDGLYRSHDSGRNWYQLQTLPVSLVRGLGVSPALDDAYRLAVTTYGGGAYFTDDLGESWTIANQGLLTTRLADIEFSPSHWQDGVVIAGEKEHLPKLHANGRSWIENDLVYQGFRRWLAIVLRYHANLPAGVSTELLLSDFERTQIWPMQLAFSPQYADDATIFIGHRRHGVWRSSNGGEDWDRDWEGELSFVLALAVSPAFADDQTVFAAMRGAGIYKTDNGGKTWRTVNNGFRFLDTVRQPASPNYVIDRPLYAAMKDVLLVVSPDFKNDQTVYASSAEGLFRSDDAAESWQPVAVPNAVAGLPVTALGISSNYGEDGTVIASIKGHGLVVSRNKGSSFEMLAANLLEQNWELKLIEFSPRYKTDGVIVAGTEEEVLISRDRGASWSRLHRPVRFEDWRGEDRGPMEFAGAWQRELDPKFSGSSQAVADVPGARAELRFVGTHIAWLGERGPDGGQATVSIDGTPVAIIDSFSAAADNTAELFSIDNLANGPHLIEIEVADSANRQSTGRKVSVDAMDIR